MAQHHNNTLILCRKRAGFSQREVAELFGYRNGSEIARFENTSRELDMRAIIGYQTVFGVRMEELITEQLQVIAARIVEQAKLLREQIAGGPENRLKYLKLESLDALLERAEPSPDVVKETPKKRVLALDPTGPYVGYAVLQSEGTSPELIDWGILDCRGLDRKGTLRKIRQQIENFSLVTLVLENPTPEGTYRRAKGRRFIRGIVAYAEKHEFKVRIVSRNQVVKSFSSSGARTKQEIAEAIAERFPELKPRLPKPRQNYMPEDYWMSVFDAVALALTECKT